jgi:hypothetical protein
MPKLLPLPASLLLLGSLVAAPAVADPGWDHRALQSHHRATDAAEPELGPGERRVGRVVIGAPATSTAMPETLRSTTQRQWTQGPLTGGTARAPWSSRKINAGRYDGTPGASHSSPNR